MTDTKLKEDESLLHEKYELRLCNHPVLVLKTVRDAEALNSCVKTILYKVANFQDILYNESVAALR